MITFLNTYAQLHKMVILDPAQSASHFDSELYIHSLLLHRGLTF